MTRPVLRIFCCGMSRSGTTLLTTILDSHPGISMGYEMIPPPLPPAAEMSRLIADAWTKADGQVRKCGNLLIDLGHRELGVFVKRAARALLAPDALVPLLREFHATGNGRIESLHERFGLAMAITEAKCRRENTGICGFKINVMDHDVVDRMFPESRYICIIRDPRDVAASHLGRGFATTMREITRIWNTSNHMFLRSESDRANRVSVVRYEDLVTTPEPVIRAAFDRLGVPFAPEVLRFFESKASVRQEGQSHANAANLSRDFFTTSIGRWRKDLPHADVRRVERWCAPLMRRFKYPLETGWALPSMVPSLDRAVAVRRHIRSRRG